MLERSYRPSPNVGDAPRLSKNENPPAGSTLMSWTEYVDSRFSRDHSSEEQQKDLQISSEKETEDEENEM